jgi:uncharacterized protein YfkK (UPF0435 family)
LPILSKNSSIKVQESKSKINNILDYKEDYVRNPHVTSKSFNFRRTDNMMKEYEAKNLLNFYNFDYKKEKIDNEDVSSKQLYDIIKQYSGLNNEEKQNISRNMRSLDTISSKKQDSKGVNIQLYVHEKEIYKNPFKSMSQIKLNKNIYSNVVNIYTNKLQESYQNILRKVLIYINYCFLKRCNNFSMSEMK